MNVLDVDVGMLPSINCAVPFWKFLHILVFMFVTLAINTAVSVSGNFLDVCRTAISGYIVQVCSLRLQDHRGRYLGCT